MLRKMKTDDLDPVVQIWLESNRQAHSFIEADYWEKNKEEVRKMLPHSLIQVAEIEGNIVGFIGMNETKIEGLFVNCNFQSRGIGHSLIEWAKTRNEVLTLNVYQKKALLFINSLLMRKQAKSSFSCNGNVHNRGMSLKTVSLNVSRETSE